MAEKETTMVLKVDLQCPCCYKKIKKILCKFPQIRDQVYDEKGNTVKITVVCCSPAKIRDKLCCKGGKVIKSIEIKEPPKPKEPEKKKESEKPKAPEKPKDTEKPKVIVVEKPKEPEKAKVVVVEKPKDSEKPKSNGKGSDAAAATAEKPKEVPKPKAPESNPPPPEPVKIAVPVNGFPHPAMPCCGPCHNVGYGGWPCYHGYGVPPPPQPCYDGYYGYDQYGRSYPVSRCDSYFSEENPSACLIM